MCTNCTLFLMDTVPWCYLCSTSIFLLNQIVVITMKRMLNRMLRYADAIVKRGVDKLIDTIAHSVEPQTKNVETQAQNATSNGDASRVGKIYSYYLLVEFVFPYILYSAGRVAPISGSVFLQRVFKQLKNASKWSRQKVYFERPACKGKSITILCALEFYQAIIISILHHSYARFISPLSPRQAGAAGVAAVWGAPWQCRFARRRSCSGRRAAGWGGSPFQSLAPR